MNTTQGKSRKQRLPLQSTDLHTAGGAKQIMLVHIKLLDARCLIQPPENLIDNIADRQIRRINKIQGAILVTIVNATHTEAAKNFQLVFWSQDSGADAGASEVITPAGFKWACYTGHLEFLVGWGCIRSRGVVWCSECSIFCG